MKIFPVQLNEEFDENNVNHNSRCRFLEQIKQLEILMKIFPVQLNKEFDENNVNHNSRV